MHTYFYTSFLHIEYKFNNQMTFYRVTYL